MKKYIQLLVVPMLLLVLIAPQGAQAAAPVQSAATQQQIAYLYALVAQLQAQLNALQGVTGTGSATNYVSVQTDNVSVVDRSYVEMNGKVTFKQSGDARVWFEYGLNNSLNYSTESQSLDNKRSGYSYDFSLTAPDLDKNKMYYYRAVAEGDDGRYAEGAIKSFTFTGSNSSHSNNNNSNDDEPDVTTGDVTNITYSAARLEGEVDMNDFENGYVFFVYGEDEDAVDEASDENQYSDIRTSGSDLRKVVVSTNFDNDDTFTKSITSLQDDTEIYYRLCVDYTDDNDDDALVCGDVEQFTTENR